jgi:hypothetical protein
MPCPTSNTHPTNAIQASTQLVKSKSIHTYLRPPPTSPTYLFFRHPPSSAASTDAPPLYPLSKIVQVWFTISSLCTDAPSATLRPPADGKTVEVSFRFHFNLDLEPIMNSSSMAGPQANGATKLYPWRGQGTHLLDHIVNAHLGFVDLCSKCGSGPFSRKSSLDRHQLSCQGRVPARCRDCLRVFPSIIALGGHAELGLCRPMS